jgi:hypothetical protein
MYKILKQLQSDLKEINVLLVTDEWIKGYINYVDPEYVSFVTETRDNLYRTSVYRLSAILAVEFISDIRINSNERFAPKENEFNDPYILEDEDNEDDDLECL